MITGEPIRWRRAWAVGVTGATVNGTGNVRDLETKQVGLRDAFAAPMSTHQYKASGAAPRSRETHLG